MNLFQSTSAEEPTLVKFVKGAVIIVTGSRPIDKIIINIAPEIAQKPSIEIVEIRDAIIDYLFSTGPGIEHIVENENLIEFIEGSRIIALEKDINNIIDLGEYYAATSDAISSTIIC